MHRELSDIFFEPTSINYSIHKFHGNIKFSCLTHFISPVSFYTPQNNRKPEVLYSRTIVPWNLTSAFGNADVNADASFDSHIISAFRRHVGTCADVFYSFSFVRRRRESIISNQMFHNNYCYLFKPFLPLSIHIAKFFSSR